MSNPIRVFRGFRKFTSSLAVTSSTGNVRVFPDSSQLTARPEVNFQIYNSGTVPVFIEFGPTSAVTAVTPSGSAVTGTAGSMPIPPGGVVNFREAVDCAFVAAICSATATIYITPGEGL